MRKTRGRVWWLFPIICHWRGVLEGKRAEASGRLLSTSLARGRWVDAVLLDAVDDVVDLGEVLRGKQADGGRRAGDLATGCGVLLGCRSPVAKSRSPFVSCGAKAGGAASRQGSAAARGSLG